MRKGARLMKEAIMYMSEKIGDSIINVLEKIPVLGKLINTRFRLKNVRLHRGFDAGGLRPIRTAKDTAS